MQRNVEISYLKGISHQIALMKAQVQQDKEKSKPQKWKKDGEEKRLELTFNE